jgi:hypothetical protein
MSILDYSLGLATKHITEYCDKDAVIAEHREAMKCCDCEDFLRLGIEAHDWLAQADRTLRQAAAQGLDVAAEANGVLETLYREWLRPCAHAEEQIRQCEVRGYCPGNLGAFRKAREHVEQQIRLLKMEEHLESAFQGGIFDEEFWLEAQKTRPS